MDFTLSMDSQGRLVLHRPDHEDKADVRLRRAFPWSKPNRYISVRDAEGKEILLIEDLEVVPADQRKIIEEALADTSLVPRILTVQKLDVRFGYQQWVVTTDRGPIEFRVQEREDIRFLPDGRFRIKDADGNVYEMPPVHQLDPASQSALEALI